MSATRRCGHWLAGALVVWAAGAAQAASLDGRLLPRRGAEYLPGQLVVQFDEELDDARVAALMHAGGVREQRRSRFVRGLRVVALPAGESVEQGVARFSRLPGVKFAEPNYLRRLSLQPNDRLFNLQWNFRLVNAPRTWDIQQGRRDVVVAVVDSGVAHEDRPAFELDVAFDDGSVRSFNVGPFRRTPDWGGTGFTRGHDAVVGAGFAWDDVGHGTHVASTIAEATNNGDGLAGLAFNVTLMPIKACISLPFIDPDIDFCPSDAVAEGIDYARVNGAKVVNLSLGGPRPAQVERAAVQRAAAANIVIVAASGNEGGPVGYPAAFEEVIAVGAVDGRRGRASYSNFGPELDLVAPGGSPFDDADNNGTRDFVFQQTFNPDLAATGDYTRVGYFGFVGTSMASPHVAAAAALLISQGISDARAVRAALERTASDLGPAGRDDQYGHGMIDIVAALSGLGLNR